MSEKIKIVVKNNPVILTGSSGGGGSINGSYNGLTTVADKIKLGGDLTEATVINTRNNFLTIATSGSSITAPNARLFFGAGSNSQRNLIAQASYNTSSYADFRVGSNSGTTTFQLNSTFGNTNIRSIGATTLVNGLKVEDSSGKGLYYNGNYAATFENRSLPDVGFVTGLTSGLVIKLNTFTGSTLPNVYLSKSAFNTYSGLTANRLVIVENNYVTGYTSLAGNTLLGTKLGLNLRFKGLVAGTNITLTPTSTGITISSSGSGGSGTITGATNGLQVTGTKLKLGGSITGNTTINAGSNTFILSGSTGSFRTNATATVQIRGRGTTNGALLRLENSTGGTEMTMNDSGNTRFFGKVTMTPSTQLSGLNIGTFAGNPSTLNDGDLWFNTSGVHLAFRIGGSTQYAMRTSTGGNGNIAYSMAAGSSFFGLTNNFSWDNTNSILTLNGKLALGNTTSYTSPTNGAIVYSGSTNAFQFRENGVWNSYLNRSLFNSYSATTLSSINSKLSSSTFNAYTASTTGSIMLTRVVGSNTTLSNSDLGKTIEVTGSTNRTITITSSGLTNGFQCNINNLMASNTVTLVAGPGTTLQLTGTILATQYAGASIYLSGNACRGFGNLS